MGDSLPFKAFRTIFFVFLAGFFLIHCSDSNNNSSVGEPDPSEVVHLSTGSQHACVSTVSSTKPYCWGSGANGKLGNEATDDLIYPTVIDIGGDSEEGIRAVSASHEHTCYINEGEESQLFCFGSDDNDRLGGDSADDPGLEGTGSYYSL